MFNYIFCPTDIPISIPKEMASFKCLILIEREVADGHRNEVSKTLVNAGCLFAMAWGFECSEWDDSVDWAFLEHYNFGEYPEEKFVMTTWHDDDTLEETVTFAKHCAQYSDVQLDNTLVLDFGKHERGDYIENLYLRV